MNNSQPRCCTIWFGLQKGQKLGDKAIEQPEMLLASKGQSSFLLGVERDGEGWGGSNYG